MAERLQRIGDLRRVDVGQRPEDRLGLAGGSRRVADRSPQPAFGRRRRRLSGHERGERLEPVEVTLDRDLQREREPVGRAGGPVAQLVVEHEGARARVLEDAADLARRRARVERDRPQAALLGGELPHDHVDPVGQVVRNDVARLEPAGAQRVHEPVRSRREFGEGQ